MAWGLGEVETQKNVFASFFFQIPLSLSYVFGSGNLGLDSTGIWFWDSILFGKIALVL